METMRYQENKKGGKWPIVFFLMFVIIGGGLIVLGILNEDSQLIVGNTGEELQGLVDIYSKETMAGIYDEEKININEITFKIDDETLIDSSNKNFRANIVLPKISIMNKELTSINNNIKDKFTTLYESLKKEMKSVENSFTFKTSYNYYDNIIGEKRILSVTIYQRIIDNAEGATTTDKVITYNIDLEKCELVEESDITLSMFGKEHKTILRNHIKDYVVKNEMIESDKFTYALTGLENYYIKDGIFHIIFNENELVDKKYGVLDIEILNKN